MDAALNYSYVDLELAFEKTKEEVMVRAVRIKNAVKEKVGRLYDKFLGALNKDVVSAPTPEGVVEAPTDEVIEKSSYFDSDDRVPFKPAAFLSKCKVVLYTKKLREKMNRVYANHLPKQEEVELSAPEMVAPSMETAIPSVAEIPVIPDIPAIDLTAEKEEVPTAGMEQVVPDSWDEIFKNPLSAVASTEEPAGAVLEENNEPKLPDFNADDLVRSLNEGLVPEPPQVATAEVPMDFEPRLDNEEHKVLSFEAPQMETSMPNLFAPVMDTHADEDVAPTKTAIMAKVTRASNELKEKNSRISELETKVEGLETTIRNTSEKLSGYEAVIRDTVKANGKLTAENTQLQEANSALKANYNALSLEFKETVATLNEKHNKELANVRDEVLQTREQYEGIIARKDKEKEEEVTRLKGQHTKDMNAVYATIAEVLGEPAQEEVKDQEDDYERVFGKVA